MHCFYTMLISCVAWYRMQGSTVQREAGDKERAKVSPTLKDVDFVNSGMGLYVCESDQIQLMNILKSDTQVRKLYLMSMCSTDDLNINVII